MWMVSFRSNYESQYTLQQNETILKLRDSILLAIVDSNSGGQKLRRVFVLFIIATLYVLL
jgi:hypothetical protein